MNGSPVAVKHTGIGSRKAFRALGLLLFPEPVAATKEARVPTATFDRDQAFEHVAKVWGVPMLKNAEMLCEFLHGTPEDLSLVEQLPMIVPVTAVAMTQAIFDEVLLPNKPGVPVVRTQRLLPVIARCTSKAFIRSQSPIYTPAVLNRCVTLFLPDSWTQKG